MTTSCRAPDVIKNPEHYEQNVDEILQFSADLDATSKLNVEYWADGPASELPPGHWGLFAQFVSQRDKHTIDEDVKMFFAMHNASFDAGIVAWHVKRRYDGVRPITAIRYLKQGQMVLRLGWAGQADRIYPRRKMDTVQSWQQLDAGIPGVYFRSFDIFERQRHGPATVYRQDDTSFRDIREDEYSSQTLFWTR